MNLLKIMNIFKIALPGYDVKSSRPNQEAINSQYPSPKVDTLANPPHVGIININWQTSGLTFSRGATRLLASFKHNYDYVPSVLGVYQYHTAARTVNGMMPFYIGGIGSLLIDSDRTTVNVRYMSTDLPGTTPVPPFTISIRYYVFAERGAE